MVKDVLTYPNPLLSQKSEKAQTTPELDKLVQDMLDTINSYKDPQAAGLSAVQIGVPLRVLIARDLVATESSHSEKPIIQDFILVNPKFVSHSREEELDWEGCLSFPDLYGKVWRSRKIKVKYQDLSGSEQRLTASGFLARVIQHEMDHLDGVTFNTQIVGKMHKGAELEPGTKVSD